tara:strand:- start:34392 stop:34682 length:291 start_codon:yes stop_codon:yes gene_type:complete
VIVTDLETQNEYLKQITKPFEVEVEKFEDAIRTYSACMFAIQGTDDRRGTERILSPGNDGIVELEGTHTAYGQVQAEQIALFESQRQIAPIAARTS